MRLLFSFSLSLQNLYSHSLKLFLSVIMFFFLFFLFSLNYLFDLYSEVVLVNTASVSVYTPWLYDKALPSLALSLQVLDVYLYPFIYVFIVVTVLSITFCLT